jgi:formylglycine-generating enzyme required for sulfatase activity/serine/threonine protein kinase
METNSPDSQALPPGMQLHEFVIERVLGSGGFGITYLARDTSLGRRVVIKENLPSQFAWRESASGTVRPRHTTGQDKDDFEWALRNFLREAETLASLEHHGIVRVLRKFEANGTAYFVMPFVDGLPLDALIAERQQKNSPFSEDELRGLLSRVLPALDHLHERGIYHRDIKPGNILISNDGMPILIDFGSARQRLSERSMTVIESIGYTPFEQLQSRGNVGPWSDLYALGGTLYKAITGETLPRANDRAFDDPYQPLAERKELGGRYTKAFLHTIDKALKAHLRDRWQNATEWLAALNDPSQVPRTAEGVSAAKKEQATSKNSADAGFAAPAPKRNADGNQRKSYLAKWIFGSAAGIALIAVIVLAVAPDREGDRTIDSPAMASLTPPVIPPVRDPDTPPVTPPVTPQPDVAGSLDQGKVGSKYEATLPGGGKMIFRYCPPGSFTMGSPETEEDRSDDEDQVKVRITKGFWLAQTETTQAQWRAVMGTDPSAFKGADLPVENVSWDDAQDFISKLNAAGGLPAGWKWALPTEAQWEYACREGKEGKVFSFGNTLNGREANVNGNYPYGTATKGPDLEKTQTVGSYAANGWGLHDMHGNVFEWCGDWYAEKLGGGVDPAGPSTGTVRVGRGGCWNYRGRYCRSAVRDGGAPGVRNQLLGFRLAAVPAGR